MNPFRDIYLHKIRRPLQEDYGLINEVWPAAHRDPEQHGFEHGKKGFPRQHNDKDYDRGYGWGLYQRGYAHGARGARHNPHLSHPDDHSWYDEGYEEALRAKGREHAEDNYEPHPKFKHSKMYMDRYKEVWNDKPSYSKKRIIEFGGPYKWNRKKTR